MIDILLCMEDGNYIIIEDKTFTDIHDNQLLHYKENLIINGVKIPEEKIACVYLKIVEQAYIENTADVHIDRSYLLSLFQEYIGKIKNQIFRDYVDYLYQIDADAMAYKHEPICEWRKKYNHVYKGFFSHLVSSKVVDVAHEPADYGWGYVSNPAGGIWALWWNVLKGNELANTGLVENGVHSLYLQISDNAIEVKLEATGNQVNDIRWKLHDHFVLKMLDKGETFAKRSFRPGKHMTVGFIEYNEKNYIEKIAVMQEVMKGLKSGELIL